MQEHAGSDSLMLAVFDGHGEDGHWVAQHFRDTIAEAVFGHPKFNTMVAVADNILPPPEYCDEAQAAAAAAQAAAGGKLKSTVLAPCGPVRIRRDVAGALKDSLAAQEKLLLGRGDVDCSLSGCTGCVVVICGSQVTVANIGDSRVILVRTANATNTSVEGQAAPQPGLTLTSAMLSIDHKPTLANETRRILLAGGRVHAIKYEDGVEGPVRVWLRDDDVPGLAMSRSLGDTIGKKAGVISTPDIYHYTLTPRDAFLVLASDGLWEFTHPPDVAGILATTHAEAGAMHASYAAAAEAAAAAAVERGLPVEEAVAQAQAQVLPPPQHLQLALDGLAEEAGKRWHEREGVVDDMSIIIAEIGVIQG